VSLPDIIKIEIYLKGVFAKNEKGYRVTSKNIWWRLLLILLLSVASIRRKLLKTTYTEECTMQFKRRLVGRQVSLLSKFLHGSTWQSHLGDKKRCVEQKTKTMIIGCNIWIICLEFRIKLIILRSESNIATFWIFMVTRFFGMSRFFDVRLYPLSVFANTPFNLAV